MESFFQNNLSQPPIRSNKQGKGKGREHGIIGFAPRNQPEEAPPIQPEEAPPIQSEETPFVLPELDESCRDDATIWPRRISPLDDKRIPLPCGRISAVDISLSADSGASLGDLLFRFIEWNVSPPPVDLTDEDVGATFNSGTFNPPDGTTVYPTYDPLPPNLLPLVAANAMYSTYVHLIPF
jgi:hypothetical protein